MRNFLYIATVLGLVSIQSANANMPNMDEFFRCGKAFVTFYSLPKTMGDTRISGGMVTLRKADIQNLHLAEDHTLIVVLKDKERIKLFADVRHWFAFVQCLD